MCPVIESNRQKGENKIKIKKIKVLSNMKHTDRRNATQKNTTKVTSGDKIDTECCSSALQILYSLVIGSGKTQHTYWAEHHVRLNYQAV